MGDFIGLLPLPIFYLNRQEDQLEAYLKRQALLFDRIGILEVTNIQERGSELSNSINWLIEQQVLFYMSRKLNLDFLKGEKPELRAYVAELERWQSDIKDRQVVKVLVRTEQTLEKLERELKQLRAEIKTITNEDEKLTLIKRFSAAVKDMKGTKEFLEKEVPNMERGASIVTRLHAMQMEALDKVRAIPLLSVENYRAEIPTSNKHEVIEIVLNKLPLPNASTPWEAILDYRNDNDTKKSLRALRTWISKISSKDLPAHEIEDELQFLMDEFDNHMRLHKLKADTEALQTLVKAPLGLIENLLRLKPTEILDPLFTFRKRQISLMEAEINAPGREIAYIFKTKELFYDRD